MRHNVPPMVGAGLMLGLGLASCADNPVPEYRFTTEQLAWQPYRVGDVLRFGQARSSKVRTFVVTELNDRLESYSQGGNAPVYLGPPSKSKGQAIDVLVRRTDTLRYVFTPTSTPARPDSIPYTGTTAVLSCYVFDARTVVAYVDWDIGFGSVLPLGELTDGTAPLDTMRLLLLPTLTLGGISYGPVVRLANQLSPAAPTFGFPRARPARLVYYAKGHGVVGFVEGGVLWYRLP